MFESSQMREGVHVMEYKIAKMGLVSWLVMDEIEDPGIVVLLDDLQRPFQSGLMFFLFDLSEGFLYTAEKSLFSSILL